MTKCCSEAFRAISHQSVSRDAKNVVPRNYMSNITNGEKCVLPIDNNIEKECQYSEVEDNKFNDLHQKKVTHDLLKVILLFGSKSEN